MQSKRLVAHATMERRVWPRRWGGRERIGDRKRGCWRGVEESGESKGGGAVGVGVKGFGGSNKHLIGEHICTTTCCKYGRTTTPMLHSITAGQPKQKSTNQLQSVRRSRPRSASDHNTCHQLAIAKHEKTLKRRSTKREKTKVVTKHDCLVTYSQRWYPLAWDTADWVVTDTDRLGSWSAVFSYLRFNRKQNIFPRQNAFLIPAPATKKKLEVSPQISLPLPANQPQGQMTEFESYTDTRERGATAFTTIAESREALLWVQIYAVQYADRRHQEHKPKRCSHPVVPFTPQWTW